MEQTKTEKQGWLLKLEEESWQAELIISGLAIFGSVQLPGLISEFGQWALTYFSEEICGLIYFIQLYLFVAANFLMLAFIGHFILRAIWIGLIGLNSVYPEGIKAEGGALSKVYTENFKKDFSFEKKGIEQIDATCSLVFAVATYVLLISMVIIIDLIILYGIKLLLDLFLPPSVIDILGIVLMVALLIPSFIMVYCNTEKNKKDDKLQLLAYRLNYGFGKVITHVFQKPLTFIGMVFMSHIDLKKYIFRMLLLITPIAILSMYNIIQSKSIGLANPDIIYRDYWYYESSASENYEENITENSKRIFSTIIPSELIEGNMMKIFIPVFTNEENNQIALCGEYQEEENLSKQDNRWKESLFRMNCYKQYHRITVNEKEYHPDFVEYHHPHKKEFGVLTYIPTDDFKKKERNFLRVEKLTIDSAIVYRTMVIPFWFGGGY